MRFGLLVVLLAVGGCRAIILNPDPRMLTYVGSMTNEELCTEHLKGTWPYRIPVTPEDVSADLAVGLALGAISPWLGHGSVKRGTFQQRSKAHNSIYFEDEADRRGLTTEKCEAMQAPKKDWASTPCRNLPAGHPCHEVGKIETISNSKICEAFRDGVWNASDLTRPEEPIYRHLYAKEASRRNIDCSSNGASHING